MKKLLLIGLVITFVAFAQVVETAPPTPQPQPRQPVAPPATRTITPAPVRTPVSQPAIRQTTQPATRPTAQPAPKTPTPIKTNVPVGSTVRPSTPAATRTTVQPPQKTPTTIKTPAPGVTPVKQPAVVSPIKTTVPSGKVAGPSPTTGPTIKAPGAATTGMKTAPGSVSKTSKPAGPAPAGPTTSTNLNTTIKNVSERINSKTQPTATATKTSAPGASKTTTPVSTGKKVFSTDGKGIPIFGDPGRGVSAYDPAMVKSQPKTPVPSSPVTKGVATQTVAASKPAVATAPAVSNIPTRTTARTGASAVKTAATNPTYKSATTAKKPSEVTKELLKAQPKTAAELKQAIEQAQKVSLPSLQGALNTAVKQVGTLTQETIALGNTAKAARGPNAASVVKEAKAAAEGRIAVMGVTQGVIDGVSKDINTLTKNVDQWKAQLAKIGSASKPSSEGKTSTQATGSGPKQSGNWAEKAVADYEANCGCKSGAGNNKSGFAPGSQVYGAGTKNDPFRGPPDANRPVTTGPYVNPGTQFTGTTQIFKDPETGELGKYTKDSSGGWKKDHDLNVGEKYSDAEGTVRVYGGGGVHGEASDYLDQVASTKTKYDQQRQNDPRDGGTAPSPFFVEKMKQFGEAEKQLKGLDKTIQDAPLGMGRDFRDFADKHLSASDLTNPEKIKQVHNAVWKQSQGYKEQESGYYDEKVAFWNEAIRRAELAKTAGKLAGYVIAGRAMDKAVEASVEYWVAGKLAERAANAAEAARKAEKLRQFAQQQNLAQKVAQKGHDAARGIKTMSTGSIPTETTILKGTDLTKLPGTMSEAEKAKELDKALTHIQKMNEWRQQFREGGWEAAGPLPKP